MEMNMENTQNLDRAGTESPKLDFKKIERYFWGKGETLVLVLWKKEGHKNSKQERRRDAKQAIFRRQTRRRTVPALHRAFYSHLRLGYRRFPAG